MIFNLKVFLTVKIPSSFSCMFSYYNSFKDVRISYICFFIDNGYFTLLYYFYEFNDILV